VASDIQASNAPEAARSLPANFVTSSQEFLRYLTDWYRQLPAISLADDWRQASVSPNHAAVCAVDVISGFCHEGPLSSARVGQIIGPIRDLFDLTFAAGVRNYILPQDTHPPNAPEFAEWPPHCIVGTVESETVPELANLAAANHYRVFPKNSINALVGTEFEDWLIANRDVTEFIAVGDCTDLCLYQLAMGLKLRSNALGLGYRVTVPVDCVETYDLPVAQATALGAPPHDGDLLHVVFLYHLSLNGVRVVRSIVQ
jgi:nicotinamidase-related amidase